MMAIFEPGEYVTLEKKNDKPLVHSTSLAPDSTYMVRSC